MEAAKIIRKSFKFRIYPSRAQTLILENTLDLCRELYNAALQERRDAWNLNETSISYFDQQNQLPEIKKIREDLKSVYSQVLCDVLKRCEKSFDGFFRRAKLKQKAGFPRFKGESGFDSFCYAQSGFSLDENKLKLSKIGKIKVKLSREIIGKVKTCTIKREVGKWFVVFSVETFAEILPKTKEQIGIDAGIENFITLSDGTQIENFRFFERTQKKLRVAQRTVSRRKKYSNSWKKAKTQVSKIHAKIRNQRNDFQHKISTNLVKDFDLIAIEKLNISGMSKGIFSKQIHDVAWSNFFSMLRYKAECADKKLVEVNPNGTSQTCICGERVEKKLNIRTHHCDKCGYKNHRDIVSAQVILKLGLGHSLKDLTYLSRESVSLESPLKTATV